MCRRIFIHAWTGMQKHSRDAHKDLPYKYHIFPSNNMNTVLIKNLHESSTDFSLHSDDALHQNCMTPVDPAACAGACLDLLAGAGASGSYPERRLKHIIYVECIYMLSQNSQTVHFLDECWALPSESIHLKRRTVTTYTTMQISVQNNAKNTPRHAVIKDVVQTIVNKAMCWFLSVFFLTF